MLAQKVYRTAVYVHSVLTCKLCNPVAMCIIFIWSGAGGMSACSTLAVATGHVMWNLITYVIIQSSYVAILLCCMGTVIECD